MRKSITKTIYVVTDLENRVYSLRETSKFITPNGDSHSFTAIINLSIEAISELNKFVADVEEQESQ